MDQVILNLNDFKNSSEPIYFPFELTDEEKKLFPNLVAIDSLVVYGYLLGANNAYTFSLFIDGSCKVRDKHDYKRIDVLKIENDVDISIDLNDINNSDLIPLSDSTFDIKGDIMALLFDSIDQNYTEIELQKISNDNYEVISEDDYKKEKNNPFSHLN